MKLRALALAALLFLLPAAHAAASDVLTAITFSQRGSVWEKNFRLFTDAVTRESDGAVRFRYAGGPESIPAFEQIEAVKRGVVDVALLPAAYFVPELPEADAMKLSPYMPWQERTNGVYSFYNQLMQRRLGVLYLGRLTAGVRYHFYLKRPVRKPDFSGLKIRVTPIYEPFVRALKGVPVTMAPSEVYIGLQRGVVDGLGWPAIGLSDLGWDEVVKYVVDPGFYQTDVCVLVNLARWGRCGKDTRQLLVDVMKKAERESRDLSGRMASGEREALGREGLKTITLEGQAREYYLALAASSAWEKVLEKSPENGVKLKDMMGRKDGKAF